MQLQRPPAITANPARPAAAALRLPNVFVIAGFWVTMAYVFVAFARVFDVAGGSLRIPLVLFVLSTLALVMSGNLGRVLRSRVGLAMLALGAWIVATVPFSTWPGGSIEAVTNTFRGAVVALAVVATTVTLKMNMRLMTTYALASTTGAALGFLFGTEVEGRLAVTSGTFKDPNLYATALLLGIPIWIMLVRRAHPITRIIPLAAVGLNFAAFLRAGSRGAAIGMAAMLLLFVKQLSAGKRIIAAAAVFTTLTVGYLTLPRYLQNRYFTLFEGSGEVESAEEAQRVRGADVGSAKARRELAWDAVKLTMRYPLFGVGPGQFSYQNWLKRKTEGRWRAHFETHNTYLQFSAETGIPGFLAYIVLLFLCFRTISRIVRLRSSPQYVIPQDYIQAALTLRLVLVVYVVCSMFLSLGYSTLTFIIPAMVAALAATVDEQLPQWQRQPPLQASAVAPAAGRGVVLPRARRFNTPGPIRNR